MVAYALFRLCSTLFDIQNEGGDKKDWATRIDHADSALGHIALAYIAYEFATKDTTVSDSGAQQAASDLLSVPLGDAWAALFLACCPPEANRKTLGDAVASLSDDGFWFSLVAIGLLAFGLFSLILARYRIIPDIGSRARISRFRT